VKKHALKYVLIVSLLLNFSFLGAAGYSHYRQAGPPIAPAPAGHSVHEQAPGESAAQTHIFEALSLKPNQLRIFHEKAGLFHETVAKKQTRVDHLRSSLLDLMRADNPDRKAIQAAIVEISGAQREIQETVIDHMLEFKSMLDKDQEKKFLNLIQGAMTEKGWVQCP
jgi:Spy/CpxP family protein refolding chaperone